MDEVRRKAPAAPAADAGHVDERVFGVASDALVSDEAKQRFADLRDTDASKRDLAAEVRDRQAEIRDSTSEVRDALLADQDDSVGPRWRAARDREAAAHDRAASNDDRQVAREDREVSRWDRAVARTVEVDLRNALAEAENLAEATALIGQAQGVIMADLEVAAVDALIELSRCAEGAQVGLQEATRRTISSASNPRVG